MCLILYIYTIHNFAFKMFPHFKYSLTLFNFFLLPNTFKLFGLSIWWRLFQKRVVWTNLDIYGVFFFIEEQSNIYIHFNFTRVLFCYIWLGKIDVSINNNHIRHRVQISIGNWFEMLSFWNLMLVVITI
jgi:hypothetical protein